MAWFRLLRMQQWVKNVFVCAALLFSGKFFDPVALQATLLGFLCFCFVSSHVYILNDIHDREEDRLHPRKSRRPIASGEIAVAPAAALAVLLLLVGLAGAWLLAPAFGICVLCYVVLQFIYTWHFKHIVILDVISIASGFVLRAIGGVLLVHVPLSPWLVICTFTLCLFMGFSKRRCELNAMAANGAAAAHRRTLRLYTPELLNHMTTLTAGIAIVSFLLYTVDPQTTQRFGTNYLLYTLPIVVYAIFRFAVLVEHGLVDGPTDVVLRDRPFQAAVLLWTLAALVIVYWGRPLQGWLHARTGPVASAPIEERR